MLENVVRQFARITAESVHPNTSHIHDNVSEDACNDFL